MTRENVIHTSNLDYKALTIEDDQTHCAYHLDGVRPPEALIDLLKAYIPQHAFVSYRYGKFTYAENAEFIKLKSFLNDCRLKIKAFDFHGEIGFPCGDYVIIAHIDPEEHNPVELQFLTLAS